MKENQTLVERLLDRIKNNRITAAVIIVGLILGSVASFTESVRKIIDIFPHVGTPNLAGEWQADVEYAWNTGTSGNIIRERLVLMMGNSGQLVQGSVSLLGKSYVVRDGKVDGDVITFTTNSRESQGTGEPPLDVTYRYHGTVAGDIMHVTLFTEGSIASYSPVIKFVAQRVPSSR